MGGDLTAALDTGALARWLGVSEVVVEGSPGGGGWSNETVFVRAGGAALVVRLAPRGRSMFPTYDLSHQVHAMRYARANGVAAPVIVGFEPGADVLGRPFFVMERVAGRVPPDDDPPFTKAGFLFDAAPELQRRFHDGAIHAIGAVNRLGMPPFPTVGPTPAGHLSACASLADFSETVPPELGDVHAELSRSVPATETDACGLLWGDARPANMVVDSAFSIVALLDWELAASGPGEFDIAWFCEMNRMRAGNDGGPPLAGFPDDDTSWQQWEAAVGRAATDVAWHRLFAAYRVSVFLQLYLSAMVERGMLPAGHRVLGDNIGTRRLRQLLA